MAKSSSNTAIMRRNKLAKGRKGPGQVFLGKKGLGQSFPREKIGRGKNRLLHQNVSFACDWKFVKFM